MGGEKGDNDRGREWGVETEASRGMWAVIEIGHSIPVPLAASRLSSLAVQAL